MKLWLLKRNNWQRRYDLFLEVVIRAETEADARRQAVDTELRNLPAESVWTSVQARERICYEWIDSTKTACEAISESGTPGVVASNFRHS